MITYHCPCCEKYWSYPIKQCIFCKGEIETVSESKYKVIGSTQVFVPSTSNEKVPYFVYLLEDRNGNRMTWKAFEAKEIGDMIDFTADRTDDNTVGVIGTGTLGLGIAEYLLRNHCAVVLKTRSEHSITKSKDKISKKLSKDHTTEDTEKLLKGLTITTEYRDLAGCELIIEAVVEEIQTKKAVFKELSSVCSPETIFATNTSSLSIDAIAVTTDRPERFIGVHFFNPVSKMDLVEVIIGASTSEATKDRVIAFCQAINKKPISVSNAPGFIVNRLLLPQINDAVRLYEAGVARKEDIDAAMKMGLNHPMGPFALADLIGIDICVMILLTLYSSLNEERFKPARTLMELYDSRKLGFKTGEGFYKYR
ncbi:MAG TPA: 3-hydroxyacyl-CoA dehydrogenase family protein [Methanocella sp.]|nr:3-hydroxyacyl-CoA dehydrogenase family protein [Methanocella sp.]